MVTSKNRPPAEMVGATSTEFEIGNSTVHTVVPIQAKPETFAALQPSTAGQPTPRKRTYLNIENLTSTHPAPAYDVYLNVPEGSDPSQVEEQFAGRIAMFGLVETSRPGNRHSGSGLHYVLDVTDLIKRLAAQPGWKPGELRVSFVPTRESPSAQVHVGRVSLYVGEDMHAPGAS